MADIGLPTPFDRLVGHRVYADDATHVLETSMLTQIDLRTVGSGHVGGGILVWDHRLSFDPRDGAITSWRLEVDRGQMFNDTWTSSPRGDPSFEFSRNVRHDLVAPVIHDRSTFIHSLMLAPRYPGPAERDGTIERDVVHLYLPMAMLRPATARYHRTGERTWVLEVLEDRIELETDDRGVVVDGPLRLVGPERGAAAGA